MEEIKVNDFIRTKDGYIGKVTNVGDEFSYDYIYQIGNVKYAIGRQNITKHSSNIIDLIECGDVIVTKHPAFEKTYCERIESNEYLTMLKEFFKEKSIILLSIVTHQQFNSIKYEVK